MLRSRSVGCNPLEAEQALAWDVSHTIQLHGSDLHGYPSARLEIAKDDHRVLLRASMRSRWPG